LQTQRMHKYGINVGLTPGAKGLLRPAMTSSEVSAIINREAQRVDGLHMIIRGDGCSFVEVVSRTADHECGITVFFLALTDRLGAMVPESAWSDEEIAHALKRLEESNTLAYAERLKRRSAPPTSWKVN